MPVSFQDHDNAPTCMLAQWEIKDIDLLAKALAWLYLRKPLHAAKVIAALGPSEAYFPGKEFEAARRLLLWPSGDIAADLQSADDPVRQAAEKKRDKRIEQRDGLLFQHLSWVAAHLKFPGSHLSAPHVRKADKGFDGVMIRIEEGTTSLATVMLCEDKATIDPRSLVTQSVWEEIRKIEQGDKDLEIHDAVTALLGKIEGIDIEMALKGVSWDKLRQYRVALTVPHAAAQANGYAHIFDGYDQVTGKEITSRIAEYIALPDVRAFLDELARLVLSALDELEKSNSV
jgi:hypothetical protein